jgi:hypothetical protein
VGEVAAVVLQPSYLAYLVEGAVVDHRILPYLALVEAEEDRQ